MLDFVDIIHVKLNYCLSFIFSVMHLFLEGGGGGIGVLIIMVLKYFILAAETYY